MAESSKFLSHELISMITNDALQGFKKDLFMYARKEILSNEKYKLDFGSDPHFEALYSVTEKAFL